MILVRIQQPLMANVTDQWFESVWSQSWQRWIYKNFGFNNRELQRLQREKQWERYRFFSQIVSVHDLEMCVGHLVFQIYPLHNFFSGDALKTEHMQTTKQVTWRNLKTTSFMRSITYLQKYWRKQRTTPLKNPYLWTQWSQPFNGYYILVVTISNSPKP